MVAYYKVRLLTTAAVLALLIAAYFWHRVDALVAQSPYWAQSTSEAMNLGTFVQAATIPGEYPVEGDNRIALDSLWLEHSHSYVRTGPFTARIVVNPELAVHALFRGSELVKRHMRDGWVVVLDDKQFEPVLASSGSLVGSLPFNGNGNHRLKITSAGKVMGGFGFEFSEYVD